MKKTARVFWLLTLLVVISLPLYGCGKTNKSQTGKPIAISDPEIDKIIANYKEEVPYRDTSSDKIDADLASDKINSEQYATLQIVALFQKDKLPGEYQGDVSRDMDHAFLFGLIDSNWDKFSSTTQAALMPFLLPPDNPNSYYNDDLKDIDRQGFIQKLLDIKTAQAAGGYEEIKPQDKISVFYKTNRTNQDFHEATWIAQAVTDSISSFQNMLGVATKPINIYVQPQGLTGYGESSINPIDKKCVVRITSGLDEKMAKSVAAHEIFHCFQYFIGLKYEKPDMKWLMEATATWSEEFIYHTYNREHEYDPSIFGHTNWDMLSLKDTHHYGSYLWFYYIYQKAGYAPQEIANVLLAAKTKEPRDVVASRPNFNYDFKEYALYNWNQDQFKYYYDEGGLPTLTPSGGSFKIKKVNGLGNNSEPVQLEKGGIKYYFYVFTNSDINKIEFTPKDFVGDKIDTSGLQALYKIGDVWQEEDWSGMEKRDFCRTLDEENVSAIVLISSNSDLKNTASGAIKVTTAKKCDPGWRSNIHVSWKWGKETSGHFLGTQATGKVAESGDYFLHENLIYNKENDSLDVLNQQMSATWRYQKNISSDNECGLIWSSESKNTSGSGYYDYSKKAENVGIIRVSGNGDNATKKIGGKYSIGFGMLSPPSGKENDFKLKSQSVSRRFSIPCGLIISLPEPSGLEQSFSQDGSNELYNPPTVDIEIKPDDTHLSGHATAEIYDTVNANIDWELSKVN